MRWTALCALLLSFSVSAQYTTPTPRPTAQPTRTPAVYPTPAPTFTPSPRPTPTLPSPGFTPVPTATPVVSATPGVGGRRAFLFFNGVSGWTVATDGTLVFSEGRLPVLVEINMAGKWRTFRLVEAIP
jgi:hypothetical protein